MLISDETRDRIIQNLEKTDYSFHYKEKEVSQELTKWIKERNRLWYVTFFVAVFLIILDFLNIYDLNKSWFIIIIFWLWIVWKTIMIVLEHNFSKFRIIEEYIKNKEISEISEDDFLLEYYSLDNIKSEKGEKMIKDNFLGKRKKRK